MLKVENRSNLRAKVLALGGGLAAPFGWSVTVSGLAKGMTAPIWLLSPLRTT